MSTEDKNKNVTADSKQNIDIKSEVNNAEEKNTENEFSDLDNMSFLSNHYENNSSTTDSAKQFKLIKTILIVIVLLLPLVYILYKTSGKNNAVAVDDTKNAQAIDIAAFENVTNSNPTFNNLLNLSNAYITSAMPEKAIERLKKALELEPKSAVANSNIGLAYTMIKDYKKGIAYCERAIEIDTAFQLAKNNLNWAKTEQNKIFVVINELIKTPEKDKDNNFNLNLGLNYLKVQEFDKSIELWNKILVKDPKNSAALNNIGVAYMSLRQFDNAIKSFQKAIDLNANDQLAKNNLAWALDETIKNDVIAQKNKADNSQKK